MALRPGRHLEAADNTIKFQASPHKVKREREKEEKEKGRQRERHKKIEDYREVGGDSGETKTDTWRRSHKQRRREE